MPMEGSNIIKEGENNIPVRRHWFSLIHIHIDPNTHQSDIDIVRPV